MRHLLLVIVRGREWARLTCACPSAEILSYEGAPGLLANRDDPLRSDDNVLESLRLVASRAIAYSVWLIILLF